MKKIKSHLSVLRLSHLSVLRLTGAVWRLWRARRQMTRVPPGNTSFLVLSRITGRPCPLPLSRESDSESFRQFSKTSVRAVNLSETQPLEIYCSISLKISKHFICLWSITIWLPWLVCFRYWYDHWFWVLKVKSFLFHSFLILQHIWPPTYTVDYQFFNCFSHKDSYLKGLSIFPKADLRRFICGCGGTSKKFIFYTRILVLPGFPEVPLELRDIGTMAHPSIDDKGQGMLFPCQHVLISFKSACAHAIARDYV